ncbi:MAG: MlaD family protein [candidate division NC10 bacterium]|nr:MlaD family protein [candidate division NC10 bacterium]
MRTRDEIKAGIVIIIALLTLTALVLGVSGVSFWERHDQYTVRLRSVAGLDQGAPVRLGGLKIGRVLRLRIPPEDVTQVEIALGVRQGFPHAGAPGGYLPAAHHRDEHPGPHPARRSDPRPGSRQHRGGPAAAAGNCEDDRRPTGRGAGGSPQGAA